MAKVLIVYDSVYGNTEKLARFLASGLENGGVHVEVVKVDSVEPGKISSYDLLCIGTPVHAWGPSKSTKEFLERLKSAEGLTGKKAFAFDTKMKSRLAGTAGGKVEGKLKDLGMTIARPSESVIVLGREGPLEESAEGKFKQIGTELAKILVS